MPGISPSVDALIVVDLQRGFMNEHTRHLCEPIERIQSRFHKVIATRYFRREKSLLTKLLGIDGFHEGSPDCEFAFRPRADALLLDKTTYSCVDKEFVDRLRGWSVERTYICGVDTDQCVLMIAADLLQSDIVPIVCEDLTASAAGPQYHDSGLFLLRRLIGREQVRAVL
ncbi:MAG: cysteine hydrolase [Candidatus Eremiobacteraeota bacterium]|nr:cysteine hydrolase [Candidatus Eremiobacteraeota bacterium]